ncbi:MAG: hypothetical protein ACI8XO_002649 [Verrucomicrobiales bacterium]
MAGGIAEVEVELAVRAEREGMDAVIVLGPTNFGEQRLFPYPISGRRSRRS